MRVRSFRFAALALTVLPAATLAAPAVAGSTAADVPTVVIDGKGFGHGVGMAQDGAFWMGKAGSTTPQILGHFYPGTSIGKAAGSPSVRIGLVTSTDGSAVMSFPQGGEVRDGDGGAQAPGFPVRVPPGGQARVRYADGRYVVTTASGTAASSAGSDQRSVGMASARAAQVPPPGQAQVDPPSTTSTSSTPPPTLTPTTAPPPSPPSPTTTTTPPPTDRPPGQSPPAASGPSTSRPVRGVASSGGVIGVPARSRTYRGVIEATAVSGPLRLVNQVDVETYLKGMGEVRDPTWPPASLRAQAVAARTYALRAMAASGELCDSQRCQVYLGSTAEYGAMNKAVTETAGQVVMAGKALASTVYSSNGGGVSASREEGFGTTGGGYAYLRSAPYLTKDPKPWHVEFALTDVAARLRYPGELSGVRAVAFGASGRVTSVELTGSSGPKTVTGLAFDAALGLRSTLFTLKLGSAVAAPAPPPPAEGAPVVQAPPDQLGEGDAVGLYLRMSKPAELSAPPDTSSPEPVTATAASVPRDNESRAGLVVFTLVALVAVVGALLAAAPPSMVESLGPRLATMRASVAPRLERVRAVSSASLDRLRGAGSPRSDGESDPPV